MRGAKSNALFLRRAIYIPACPCVALVILSKILRVGQHEGFASAQRQRKKVEALFAELKNQIGLRRLPLRRLKFVREQFFLAAAAQNIKRLVRFLGQESQAPTPVTTSFPTSQETLPRPITQYQEPFIAILFQHPRR